MPLVRQRQPRTPASNILRIIINISGSRNLHKAQDRGNNTRSCREIASNGLHTQASCVYRDKMMYVDCEYKPTLTNSGNYILGKPLRSTNTQASRTSYTSIKQGLRVIRIAEPFLLQFEEKRPLQYAQSTLRSRLQKQQSYVSRTYDQEQLLRYCRHTHDSQ